MKNKKIMRCSVCILFFAFCVLMVFGCDKKKLIVDENISDTPPMDRDDTSSSPTNFDEGSNKERSIKVKNASEIQDALIGILPGDTIIMLNGDWFDQNIIFEGDGKIDSMIVLRAETAGQVILKGQSSLHIGGSYLKVDGLVFKDGYVNGHVIEFRSGKKEATFCQLTNVVVDDYNLLQDPNDTGDNKWVSLFGYHNRVDHCYFAEKTSVGATLVVWRNNEDGNYHIIDSNYFGHRSPLGQNGGETIRIGTSGESLSSSYTLIKDNYFYRCNGEVEIVSSKSGENVFKHNTFYECNGALTLRHGNDCEVKENLFIGNNKDLAGGVRVIGSRHIIDNNYFKDLGGTGARGAITLSRGQLNPELSGYWPIEGGEVKNNILINCKQNIEVIGEDQNGQVIEPVIILKNNQIFSSLSVLPPTIEIPQGISESDAGPCWNYE